MGTRKVRDSCWREDGKFLTELCRGLAVEDDIPVTSLVDGEECWLSNGVRGFMFGRIELAVKAADE